jgi:hypothetical protein
MTPPQRMELMQINQVSDSVDTNSGIKLSELAKTVADNYNKYHLLEQQLISIQEWISEQRKLYNE